MPLSDRSDNKLASEDRIFSLQPIAGKHTAATSGLVDNRLFTGDNRLHAILDTRTRLWSLKYDSGAVPQPLKQKFLSFKKLKEYVIQYFAKRNIEVKEIIY